MQTETISSNKCVSVFDLENIAIPYRYRYNDDIDIKIIDKWIYENYNPIDNIVGLDSKRNNGYREIFLDLGWTVIDIRTKFFDNQKKVNTIIKNAVDNELVLSTYDLALKSRPKFVLLFTGDCDYLPLIKRLKKLNIKVHIVAFQNTMSNCLKKYADKVFFIEDILNKNMGVNN